MKFKLNAPYKMSKGQEEAVLKLHENFNTGKRKQTLLGITGSGKTFIMANMIERIQKPTLIISHNKTLAAQLYSEIKQLFPENRVEFFISYYDYYQPESYLPTTDTYIEKEATINEEIEKFRLKATASLMSREDVIVIASISCIYGLGNPQDFMNLAIHITQKEIITRTEIIRKLINIQYERNDNSLEGGLFRVRGNIIDIIPAYDDTIIRIELEGNKIKKISEHDKITLNKITDIKTIKIYPAKQYVVPEEKQQEAINNILTELEDTLPNLEPLEAERLKKRVKYDIEMLEEVGYCSGIENYSKHFDGRKSGEPPFVLLNYFPEDFLLIIDESHQTLPQSRAMYNGDYSRKKNLVEHGFRLPSAYDNRPLKFHEFEKYLKQTLFVSATPGDYELEQSDAKVDLIVRPTGLLDPIIEVKPTKNQIQDIIHEIEMRCKANERTLITTLTKRMAEDLTEYLAKENIRVRYMHSEIGNLDRVELIRQLRAKEYDVLVGINLLREGLDLPEVSLICILDADREGFLRDERSLIQTIGRAARNINGKVIMYADKITKSMKSTIEITKNRREAQIKYNKQYGIEPATILKKIDAKKKEIKNKHLSQIDTDKKIIELETNMRKYAEKLDFERAIMIREELTELKAYKDIRQEQKEYEQTKKENNKTKKRKK
ncbi:MAG: excinuclease ABC subunit UvrB [Candidatus Woesearchaeota archaeon]